MDSFESYQSRLNTLEQSYYFRCYSHSSDLFWQTLRQSKDGYLLDNSPHLMRKMDKCSPRGEAYKRMQKLFLKSLPD